MPLLTALSPLPSNRVTIREQGLTLIELLIAMAIFAVMAASMFIAFDNVQKAKEVTERASDRLKQYQVAFNRIGQDLQQIVSRPTRNEFGDLQFSLDYLPDGELQFTRTGWTRSSFFTQQQRSELQRVGYYLEDGKLMRAYYRSLDQANGEQPVRTVLLDGVNELSFKFAYIDYENRQNPTNGVLDQWPPAQLRPAVSAPAAITPPKVYMMLPLSIDMTLVTADLGTINRSYLIAAGAEYVFKP